MTENVVQRKQCVNEISISTFVFIVGMSLLLVSGKLSTTMIPVPKAILRIFTWGGWITLLFKIVFYNTWETQRQVLLSGGLIALGLVVYVASSYSEAMTIGLLIVAAKDIEFDKVLKVYIAISGIIIVSTLILVNMGLIENVIVYRGTVPRYGMGFIYATDFAATIFWIMIASVYLVRKKGVLPAAFLCLILAGVVMHFSDSRLSTYMLLFLAMLLVVYKIFMRYMKVVRFRRWYLWCCMLLSFFWLAISIWTAKGYEASNWWFGKLNNLLSGRLIHANRGIERYGITAFGQFVKMNGWGGGATRYSQSHYFFIDCFYLNSFLRFGIIFTIVICIIFSATVKRQIKKGDFLFSLLFILIVSGGFIEHHMMEIAYNPFIFMMASTTTARNEISIKGVKD